MEDKDLLDYVKQKEEEIEKIEKERFCNTSYQSRDKERSDKDIDYARVLYSSSFRRLQGKMQLLIPEEMQFYRNRLTHSLEVSQIARSLAKRLKLKDTLTVQTCALAHDIGNPPFGHAGEYILDDLCDKERYEGNAQTFRILTSIEKKFNDCSGINLNRRTLLGIVKYFNTYKENKNKFLYENDYDIVKFWVDEYDLTLKTIDCQIMDLADEIAYAAHDLEDALRMKYFNIDDIIYEFSISEEYCESGKVLKQLSDNAKKYAFDSKCINGAEFYSSIFLKELTSQIVNELVTDIGLTKDENEKEVLGYKNHKALAKGLKKLTFKSIKRSPTVIRYERLGKKVITGLYEVLTDVKYNKDLVFLPPEYRDKGNVERSSLDYIGGMMDSFAINQYKTYFGSNSLDKLYLDEKETSS